MKSSWRNRKRKNTHKYVEAQGRWTWKTKDLGSDQLEVMPFGCTKGRKWAKQGEGAAELEPSSPPRSRREPQQSSWAWASVYITPSRMNSLITARSVWPSCTVPGSKPASRWVSCLHAGTCGTIIPLHPLSCFIWSRKGTNLKWTLKCNKQPEKPHRPACKRRPASSDCSLVSPLTFPLG